MKGLAVLISPVEELMENIPREERKRREKEGKEGEKERIG